MQESPNIPPFGVKADGCLGLGYDLGSGKQSYIEHLMINDAISQRAFSLEMKSMGNLEASIIFGKFDNSLPKSTFKPRYLFDSTMSNMI